MEIDKFIDLVAEMRTAQKNYFSSRSPYALSKSKRLECDVDRALAELSDVGSDKPHKDNAKQLSLF